MLMGLHFCWGGRQYVDTLVNYTTWYMMTRWKVKQGREISAGVVRFLDRIDPTSHTALPNK